MALVTHNNEAPKKISYINVTTLYLVFAIPATVVNKLDAMIIRFFWCDSSQKRIHWKANETLHQPKGHGGLGIRSIGCFNNTLLMKKVWRIFHQPDLLVSKVFRGAFPFHSWILSTKSNISLGRKGLLWASSNLQGLCAWKVGNDTSLKAASHAWLKGEVPAFRDCISLREACDTTVANLILPDN